MSDWNMPQWQAYPALRELIGGMLVVWPEHHKYLTQRFRADDEAFLARTEEVAAQALALIGNQLPTYCADYRWMCANFVEEQIYFQRHGDYRLSNFAEVNREIYGNVEYMTRYVNGILLSQIFWGNHARAMDCFRQQFLPRLSAGSHYLEVGPGHGLFMYFAAQKAAISQLTGWDVSPASITQTRHALRVLGVSDTRCQLVQQDIFNATIAEEAFDAAVISEVLEHLEAPQVALASLYRVLRKGGQIFINVPINSPAPDHIYLWRTTDALDALVTQCGFTIEEAHYLPVSGRSLEYCRKYNLDISCVYIARK